ncbi:TetR/AcrR family transcriptional regulator [Streptomyces sp. BBFR51]|uniref:TetR/AcrR family transcriptional regulator n=1 Tax=Streptomyces sp. BBFR51 TaxID=3372856 RepID=UPI0037DD42B4
MTVWDRPEPPTHPVPLDRERIVAAAIALADEGGLEAVSLRKVAARLNAGPMRLYRYISTKEELFDLMMDEVQAEILPEEQPGDWREALRILAHRTRQAALRHEWLADLLGGRPALGPNSLAVTETTLGGLDAHLRGHPDGHRAQAPDRRSRPHAAVAAAPPPGRRRRRLAPVARLVRHVQPARTDQPQ